MTAQRFGPCGTAAAQIVGWIENRACYDVQKREIQAEPALDFGTVALAAAKHGSMLRVMARNHPGKLHHSMVVFVTHGIERGGAARQLHPCHAPASRLDQAHRAGRFATTRTPPCRA
jgi:hypothetical protein